MSFSLDVLLKYLIYFAGQDRRAMETHRPPRVPIPLLAGIRQEGHRLDNQRRRVPYGLVNATAISHHSSFI